MQSLDQILAEEPTVKVIYREASPLDDKIYTLVKIIRQSSPTPFLTFVPSHKCSMRPHSHAFSRFIFRLYSHFTQISSQFLVLGIPSSFNCPEAFCPASSSSRYLQSSGLISCGHGSRPFSVPRLLLLLPMSFTISVSLTQAGHSEKY